MCLWLCLCLLVRVRVGVAMAFDTGTNNGTRMLGPALGGFLLEFMGLHGAYLLGAVFYASAAYAILRMPYYQARPAGPPPKVFANLVEGFRYARNEPSSVYAHTMSAMPGPKPA